MMSKLTIAAFITLAAAANAGAQDRPRPAPEPRPAREPRLPSEPRLAPSPRAWDLDEMRGELPVVYRIDPGAAPEALPPGVVVLPEVAGFSYTDRPMHVQFYQEDPADSLYRAAHALFSRQEYRPAADRYSALRARFPTSRYLCDASYYEAFSRYRLGTQNDLRTGYRVLSGMSDSCTSGARRADVPELLARINSALARGGDSEAEERLRRAASQGQVICDRDERNVKIEALSALVQMDPASANTTLRRVLATRDACMAPMRSHALTLVARQNNPEAVATLAQVARSDGGRDLQLEAVRALGRMNNDAAYSAMEEFLRSSNDERIQVEAASAMAKSENPRAQTAVRALIERNDVAERIRSSAITSLASRTNIGTEYWRTLYGRVESDELRKAIVFAAARNDSQEAQEWITSIARNTSEPYAAREAAISRIRASAPIPVLHALLQNADSRSMRMSIVSGLAGRKEPEATDRLIDIAKTSTDPEVRSAAIRALTNSTRRNDPRVLKALSDLAAGGV